MTNFFKKLLISEPQKSAYCADRVYVKTSCRYKSGCGQPTSGNAKYSAYFDLGTGDPCSGWSFEHCGCGF